MTKITYVNGDTLIEWGFTPGRWFGDAIKAADALARENHFGAANHTKEDFIALVKTLEPLPVVTLSKQDPSTVPTFINLEAETDYEKDNLAKVKENIREIAEVPIVRAIAVMPDACPQGGGGIPVGAVAVAENSIVPGWHSADICCSVAISVFPSDTDCTKLLDAGMALSHFGKGGRNYSHDMQISQDLLDEFERNPYLSNKGGMVQKFYGTQGDGNHFFYVGRLASTGQVALVTHHGSRKPGASLYSHGIEIASELTAGIMPGVHKNNLWIPYDTQEGQDYWEALQLVRRWTKGNHFTIHDAVAKQVGAKIKDRYWNEHNFVFKREFRGKSYFVHAKGATPVYAGFGPDAYSGKALIPLNMSEPILIVKADYDYDHGMDFNHNSLGFAPHGAGRNYSRTEFGKLISGRAKEIIGATTAKYDIRAYSGKHDISEFPEAYKDANKVREQINQFGLTQIIDTVEPFGCIMAGHDGRDWKALKKAKKEKRDKIQATT